MEQNIWKQWDKQENEPVIAHIDLNNLYLAVERGSVPLTAGTLNTLWCLVEKAYSFYGMKIDSFQFQMQKEIIAHWYAEIEKLPNFVNC